MNNQATDIGNALLAELRNFAEELADTAGPLIMRHFRSTMQVEDKGGMQFDPVTVADKAAERLMRELIQARYPDHGILGEEEAAVSGSSPLTWVLDPIDGTRAFITGLPLWGTLIALNDGLRPVIGLMDQPFTKERFIGVPGAAYRNGERLHSRPCSRLDAARLMCTTPAMFTEAGQRAAFEHIAGRARLVRYGGDCYAYCMLAAGHVDVVIEESLQPYDVQALIPIVEGAGGRMSSWDGGDAQQGGAIVACGDPGLHEQILAQLRQYA